LRRKFAVKLSRKAAGQLGELEPGTALDIAKRITILEVAPLPAGKLRIKKLKGFTPPLYRLRAGRFRVLYRIVSRDEVVVLRVVARRDLERELKKLLDTGS